jgi:hypothetical protein
MGNFNNIDEAVMAYCNKRREQCGIKPATLEMLKDDKQWPQYVESVRAAITAYSERLRNK